MTDISPDKFRVTVAPARILMTADPVGGVWTYSLELAQALSAHGVEIALATMGQSLTKEQHREVAGLSNVTLYESCYRLEWMKDPWDDLARSSEWLLSIADEIRPDLVHLNGYVHGSLPWKCPCMIVAHSCVLSWWKAVRRDKLPDIYRTYHERVAEGLAAANLVVAPTAAMLKEIESCYLPLPNRVVIHNGRSFHRFTPGKKKQFVLSVGRIWDEGKNISVIAKMAPMLSWPVYVAGEQTHPDGEACSIQNIKSLGYMAPDRIASWFATASVYAHPARYEPFGLTILEAAMSKCALVLGDIPSLRELWQDAAVFVPPDDFEVLGNEIQVLCQDRKRLECMAQKAFDRSMCFGPVKMANDYMAAYASLNPGWRE